MVHKIGVAPLEQQSDISEVQDYHQKVIIQGTQNQSHTTVGTLLFRNAALGATQITSSDRTHDAENAASNAKQNQVMVILDSDKGIFDQQIAPNSVRNIAQRSSRQS